MASTSNTAEAPATQPVVFTTQTQYPLPSQKFMIPSTWKRYQLSQLINKALSLEKPVPFDFLVRGEILRTTVAEWCSENGVGEEETLQIEYIESVMPPQKMSDFPQDDWVSSVSCSVPGLFFTASYDGYVRAFDYGKKMVLSSSIHTAPITSVSIMPSSEDNADSTYTIATASHDQTAHLTKVNLEPSAPSSNALASLRLHTGPVSSIAFSSNSLRLLTSSWDGLIGYWDTVIPSVDEVPDSFIDPHRRKSKKRKTEDEAKPRRKAPLHVLKSHTARVSKVVFSRPSLEQNEAFSCGFDSTVRAWDLDLAACKQTIAGSEKPFLDLCLAPSTSGSQVLATSTDRTMTLYDFRSSGLSSSVSTFFHPSTPSCVTAGDNPSSQQVITGSYDGTVRLWDLRSSKGALAAFKAFDGSKKVLSVSWSKSLVAIGGEGGLSVWKVGEDAESSL